MELFGRKRVWCPRQSGPRFGLPRRAPSPVSCEMEMFLVLPISGQQSLALQTLLGRISAWTLLAPPWVQEADPGQGYLSGPPFHVGGQFPCEG